MKAVNKLAPAVNLQLKKLCKKKKEKKLVVVKL